MLLKEQSITDLKEITDLSVKPNKLHFFTSNFYQSQPHNCGSWINSQYDFFATQILSFFVFMQISLTYKSKQFFWLLIKLSIVFACILFIYNRLFLNEELNFYNLKNHFFDISFFSTYHIITLLFLSICNWFLEIIKWKKLV
mgnify:CR=1 FL=1